MASEAEQASVLCHEFKMLPEIPGIRIKPFSEARKVRANVMAEKEGPVIVPDNLEFRKRTQIADVIGSVQRIQVIFLMEPYFLPGK
jgi:hypothetical protein